MTKRQWFDLLPQKAKTAAYRNLNRERQFPELTLDFEKKSMASAIMGSFDMNTSPEGAKFWEDICDDVRYKNHEKIKVTV